MGLECSKGLFYTRYNHCLHGIRVSEKHTKKELWKQEKKHKTILKNNIKFPSGHPEF